jgi:hypothetical protein
MIDDRTCVTDLESMQAAAAGDSQARAEFARRSCDSVRAWLWDRWRHTPLRSMVDDAVQEVFLECLRPDGALQHLDPARAVHGTAAFLRGVVRNVAHRIERSEARSSRCRRQLVLGADAPAPEYADPFDADSRHAQVVRALELLDGEEEPQAEHPLGDFLRLHFEEGLPVRAIARRWHDEPAHVHGIRRRACRRFRKCLLRVMHPADGLGQAGGVATHPQ